VRAVSKSFAKSSRSSRPSRSWDRLKLDWEIGLHRLPAFTQRAAVLLLGVVIAAFVLIGLLVSVQRTLPQPYLHLSPSEGEPPNGAAPAGGQAGAGAGAGAATTSTALPELLPSTTASSTPAAAPPSTNPQARPGATVGPTTTSRRGTTTSSTPSSTTTSTGWPPVTVTLPLLQRALGG